MGCIVSDTSFTADGGLHTGAHATRLFAGALTTPDSGLLQTSMTTSCSQQVIDAGATDRHRLSTVHGRIFGGFGGSTSRTNDQPVRLCVLLFYDTCLTTRLSVWVLIVPDGSMTVEFFGAG